MSRRPEDRGRENCSLLGWGQCRRRRASEKMVNNSTQGESVPRDKQRNSTHRGKEARVGAGVGRAMVDKAGKIK